MKKIANLEKLQIAINEYLGKASEDDSLIVLAFDKESGKSIMIKHGDPEHISYVISDTKSVSDFSAQSLDDYQEAQKTILNIAYNVCHMNKEYRDKLIEGLSKFDIN